MLSTVLWIIDRTAKSGKPAHIADGAGKNESAPAFGPDGLLYFVSDAAGSDQVWRVAVGPDAGTATQVTDEKADVAGFKLSPDGPRLLVWGDVPRECTRFGCDARDKGELVGDRERDVEGKRVAER